MLFKWLILVFAFCGGNLCADLVDHLKKIEDKSSLHQMRNIDFIYTINLDQRPEKFAFCNKQLNPYGIYPYRFSAVNGWELSLETVNDIGVKFEPWMDSGKMATSFPPEKNGKPDHELAQVNGKTYFSHLMTFGAIGIVLSHLSILQDAYDSGYETIWIMEDDIEVIKNPHLISDQIEKLDSLIGAKNWDILFTDKDTKGSDGNYVICLSYAWRPNFVPVNAARFASQITVGGEFRKIGARYGAYSMIVRRSGIKKMLDFYKQYQVYLPYDLEFTLPNTIQLYTVTDDIVSTIANALSDNSAPNYKK